MSVSPTDDALIVAMDFIVGKIQPICKEKIGENLVNRPSTWPSASSAYARVHLQCDVMLSVG